MNKKKKYIKEAIKSKMLSEYNFYSDDENKLLLDEDDDEVKPDMESEPDTVKPDMESEPDTVKPDMESEPDTVKPDMESEPNMESDIESELDNTSDFESNSVDMDVDDEVDEEDDVEEVDITDLTNSTEIMSKNISKIANLLNSVIEKFASTEKREEEILQNIRQEIQKRNPTEVEKLNMRTLYSKPYEVNPNDYWAEVEKGGRYQAKPDEEEYVLTQSDVDASFNPINISKTM